MRPRNRCFSLSNSCMKRSRFAINAASFEEEEDDDEEDEDDEDDELDDEDDEEDEFEDEFGDSVFFADGGGTVTAAL
jgi:hypothetical protein